MEVRHSQEPPFISHDPGWCGGAGRYPGAVGTYDTLRRLAGDRWQEYDLIFTTKVGTPIPGYAVDKAFQKLVQASGLPGIVLHGLRHSFITNALDAGQVAKDVAEYVGDRLQTILDHYTHRTNDGGSMAEFGSKLTRLTPVAIPGKAESK